MSTIRHKQNRDTPLAISAGPRDRLFKRTLLAFVFFLLAGLGTISALAPVDAHSWYPRWCCHDEDCLKVDTLSWNPDGTLHLEAGAIKLDVPKNFRIQPSEDGDAHMCVYRDMLGRSVPRCVFLPGTS